MFGFKTSVDSILSAHSKTVTKLERHAMKTDAKATKLDESVEKAGEKFKALIAKLNARFEKRVDKLCNKRDAHLKEARRAINTAVKFKQLID